MNTLKADAITIRDEKNKRANTATRVGKWMTDSVTQLEKTNTNVSNIDNKVKSLETDIKSIENDLKELTAKDDIIPNMPLVTSPDGTATIQEQIDERAHGGEIILKKGIYKVDKAITVNRRNINIIGETTPNIVNDKTIDRGTILNLNSSTINLTNEVQGFTLNKIALLASNNTPVAITNNSNKAKDIIVKDCAFAGYNTAWAEIDSVTETLTFRNVTIRDTKEFLRTTNANVKSLTIDNCDILTTSQAFVLNANKINLTLRFFNTKFKVGNSQMFSGKIVDSVIANSYFDSDFKVQAPIELNGTGNKINNNRFSIPSTNPIKLQGDFNLLTNNFFEASKAVKIEGNGNYIAGNLIINIDPEQVHYEITGDENYIVATSPYMKIKINENSERNVLVGFKKENVINNGSLTQAMYL